MFGCLTMHAQPCPARAGSPYGVLGCRRGRSPVVAPRHVCRGRQRVSGDLVRFVLNGVSMDLDAATVSDRLREVQPEPVREHGVRIGGTVYPVKQAFELGARLPRT